MTTATVETNFKKGDRVYTSYGNEVEYRAPVGDGRHVVAPVVMVGDPDDEEREWEEILDETIVSDVFAVPPRQKRIEEIADLDRQLREKRNELRDVKQRQAEIDAETALLAKKLSKFEALRRLEDYIEGRFTHVVTGHNRRNIINIEIEPFEKGCVEVYDHKGVALLTLFGDTDGNLAWQVNNYKDGSGQWRVVYPCFSEEDAKTKAGELIRATLAKVAKENSTSYDELKSLTDSAKKIGIEIDSRFWAARRDWETRFGNEQIADLQRKIGEIKAKYLGVEETATEETPDWAKPAAE